VHFGCYSKRFARRARLSGRFSFRSFLICLFGIHLFACPFEKNFSGIRDLFVRHGVVARLVLTVLARYVSVSSQEKLERA
jgi:hypothetical protein